MNTVATVDCENKPSLIDDTSAVSDVGIDQLVAAFVRIRGIDRLEGAMMTRHWLAADMGVPVTSLDGLLRLLRWQGLIELPDDHFVTVKDADAMRAIARCLPSMTRQPADPTAEGFIFSSSMAEGSPALH